jgi:hypothetical protein
MTSAGVYGGEICRYSEPKSGVSISDWIDRFSGSLMYAKLQVSRNQVTNLKTRDELTT